MIPRTFVLTGCWHQIGWKIFSENIVNPTWVELLKQWNAHQDKYLRNTHEILYTGNAFLLIWITNESRNFNRKSIEEEKFFIVKRTELILKKNKTLLTKMTPNQSISRYVDCYRAMNGLAKWVTTRVLTYQYPFCRVAVRFRTLSSSNFFPFVPVLSFR